MTALSIRNMNFALHAMEQIESERQKRLPANDERSHYWHVELERRARGGKTKWVFVRELYATKKEAAEAFRKFYQNRNPKYRLHHLMSY